VDEGLGRNGEKPRVPRIQFGLAVERHARLNVAILDRHPTDGGQAVRWKA